MRRIMRFVYALAASSTVGVVEDCWSMKLEICTRQVRWGTVAYSVTFTAALGAQLGRLVPVAGRRIRQAVRWCCGKMVQDAGEEWALIKMLNL